MRAEDRAQVSLGQRPAGADRDHRLRGRLPRPHLRGDLRRRQPELHRGLRPAAAGLHDAALSATWRRWRPRSTDQTCAVLVEPVQGEGGARALPEADLQPHARAVHRDGRAADLRRDPVRPRAHRQAVRLRVGRGRDARHHVRGQGARRRLPGRRVPGHRRGGQGHDGRLARLDLRRQSAGHGGGPGRAGGADQAGDAGQRARHHRLLRPAALGPEGPLSRRDRRDPRQGPADRAEAEAPTTASSWAWPATRSC